MPRYQLILNYEGSTEEEAQEALEEALRVFLAGNTSGIGNQGAGHFDYDLKELP